jgi:hypothetical protein
MTDKDVANLVLTLYSCGPSGFIWDYWTGENALIVWGAKVVEGVTVIIHRGSRTPEDWELDFEAIPNLFQHAGLGPVHPGFSVGMPDCWADIKKRTKPPYFLGAHSLGAGRQAILAGLMTLDGIPPLLRLAWGEPKAMFQQGADLIKGIPTRSYRNSSASGRIHDPVTDVPLSLGPFRYVHAVPLIDITSPPVDVYNPIGWHHMPLYEAVAPQTQIVL